MLKWIRQLVRNAVFREKASIEKYAAYLKKCGVQIGENVRFYSPESALVDMTCPWLISIGDNALIARGVTILTHDFVGALVKRHPKSKGRLLGSQGPVKIGKNVFIGANVVITKGVTIGDYVAIGAGSVVTSNCESYSIYAGNPAKKIMTLAEYHARREKKQFSEARTLAIEYKNLFGVNPPMEVFREYFQLFCTAEEAEKIAPFRAMMDEGGSFEDCYLYMQNHLPMFNGYEAFLEACYRN